jgi:AcrR family transcriptional regulator
MGLRAEQVEMTRARVLETVAEISGDPSAGAVTVAEVARRSGVSPATIYRHFPTRDALIAAAASHRMFVGVAPDVEQYGQQEFRSHLLALWRDLSARIALTRQAAVSETGRELRQARFDGLAPLYERALEAAGADPTSDDGRRALACLHLLQSSYALLDLYDRQGLAVGDAVDAVAWGTEALLRAIGVDPADFGVPITLRRLAEETP